MVILSAPRCLIVAPRHPDEEPEKEEGPTRTGEASKKQAIAGISQRSRLNLARQLAQFSAPGEAFHVTLTYSPEHHPHHEIYPSDGESIRLEKQRINQAAADCGVFGFWRLEFQRPRDEDERERLADHRAEVERSGRSLAMWALVVLMLARARRLRDFRDEARSWSWPRMPGRKEDTAWRGRVPHWHCFVHEVQPGGLDRFKRWWKRSTNSHHEGFFVTAGEAGRAAWYFGLHGYKDDQSPPFLVGRWCGKLNGKVVERFMRLEKIAEEVEPSEIIWLKRLMRRKQKCRGSLGVQGFTWFLTECEHARVIHAAAELATLDRKDRIRGFNRMGDPF